MRILIAIAFGVGGVLTLGCLLLWIGFCLGLGLEQGRQAARHFLK